MFSLTNIIAWITGVVNPTVVNPTVLQEDGNDVTELTDESKTYRDMETNVEHESNTNPLSPDQLSPDQYPTSDEMVVDGVAYDCLRFSDSEDWDEEISMLRANGEGGINIGKSGSRSLTKCENIPELGCDNISSEELREKTEILPSGNSGPSCEKETRKDVLYSKNTLPYYKKENDGKNHASSPNVLQTEQEVCSSPAQEVVQCERKSSENPGTDPPNDTTVKQPQEIQGNTVGCDLNEDLFQWDYMEKLTALETVFSLPRKAEFLTLLRKTLESLSSPYSFLLYLVENYYSNVIEGKNSMAHVALSHFDKWRNSEPFSTSVPTEMEKDRALWIVTTRKLFLFDLCNKVFKLDSKSNEYLQRHIYYLLENKKKYKEAVTIAYKLHLQPCFQPMEILLPLVILNKVQLAESYIADCPWQQRAFVSMLDKLCVMTDEQLEELASEIIPAKSTSCKITQASLTKLGERIVKKFELDPDDFPELFKAKNISGLSYLLHQRQKDKGRSTKKWDDLIERCVGNNLFLQQSLFKLLTDFGDKDEAKRCARFYQLPHEQSENSHEKPVNLENEREEDWENEMRATEEVFAAFESKDNHKKEGWNNSRQQPDVTGLSSSQRERVLENEYSGRQATTYLALELPMEKIYFVDDHESLRQCQRTISKHGVTLGFDAEWKPQMCQAGLAQRLSIVQLSLRDRVFILDVIALAEEVAEPSLLAFGNAVFANENVLKLGYGVESDFKALITTLPILENAIKKMKRFVDLCSLSQQLFEVPVMKRKIEKTKKSLMSFGHLSEKGLSLLVLQCLGLPLDKTYQLSDWEQRPLLEKQVVYAALDARCLIDVFDVLSKWIAEEKIEIDLNECRPRLPWLFPKRSRKAKGKLGKQPKPGSTNSDLHQLNEPAMKGSPNSPRNLRVVVDNMLQGLGRYLRCCGVDVIMLANEDEHDKAAKIARREGRILLTTGTPYYTLRSQVPLGDCMCVPAGNAKDQVLAVFKHFNITVSTNDIFSRCQVCNGNEYIKISSILMRQAYINYYESEVENHEKQVETHFSTNAEPLNVDTLLLRSGVKLQIEGLPEAILDKVTLFYCCATCGKIFWEGGHFSRICAQFSDVLNKSGSVYEENRTNVVS